MEGLGLESFAGISVQLAEGGPMVGSPKSCWNNAPRGKSKMHSRDVVVSGVQLGGFLQRDGHAGQGRSLFTQPAFCTGAHHA